MGLTPDPMVQSGPNRSDSLSLIFVCLKKTKPGFSKTCATSNTLLGEQTWKARIAGEHGPSRPNELPRAERHSRLQEPRDSTSLSPDIAISVRWNLRQF